MKGIIIRCIVHALFQMSLEAGELCGGVGNRSEVCVMRKV